ncbi:MAG: iron ABC transporter permease [Azospirillaceae bacterium]
MATTVLEPTRAAPRSNWRQSGAWMPVLGVGALLVWLVVVPLILLLISSVRPTGFPTDPGFTLQHYVDTYTDRRFWELAGNTAIFAVGSTLFALLIGITLAWLVERTDMPLKGLVRTMIILPMATPPVLLAIAWVMLLSPRTGEINALLSALFGFEDAVFNIYSLTGMIFVEGLSLVPSTFLILSPAFRNMDPSLEEAAMVSGAGIGTLLRRVVLPLLTPAILAAGVFLLIVGFVVFDIPGAIGLPAGIFTLSSRIYYLAHENPTGLPDFGQISAMAIFFLGGLILMAFGYQHYTRRASRFTTITGKGFRPRSFKLRGWRWPAFAGAAFYFTLAVLAPLAILLWTSFMPYQTGISADAVGLLTTDNHETFFSNRFAVRATTNSVTIALVAATVVALVSLLVSWIVVKSKAPGRKVIDILSFMPLAIPGVLIGLALIYVYLTVNFLPIYGSIWIIVIAYITTYLSFGSRTTHGVMLQIHNDLEDAARTSGAGWGRTMRRIVVPLAAPAIAAVWVWVLAHCMRELSSALMLQGRTNETLPVLLYGYWTGGEPNKAAAVGVWLILALLIVVGVWQFLTRRREA